jgi:enoyl-CoA hydratase
VAGDIEFERDGAVARVWLNRPEKRNALTMAVLRRLEEIVAEVEDDPGLRVLVLRGRGGTFCSGFDLDDLQATFLGKNSMEISFGGAKILERLSLMRKPTIAVLEGHVTAGGFELMLACDFAIAADTAKIGDFHIRRALIGGAGPIYRVPRLIGIRRTKELLLTGKLLTAAQAETWGLINGSASEGELDGAVDRFLGDLIDKSPLITWITKMTIDRSLDADTESLMVMEHLAAAYVMQSDDALEGVAAFLEKRAPAWSQVP